MADIVLAEYQGQAWLVSGDEFIDDLLANTLDAKITIEFVGCDSQSAVSRMWAAGREVSGSPWMIHPSIMARLRRDAAGLRVVFTPWSAMLDDAARAVIAQAARADGMALVLTRHPVAGEVALARDLGNLRLHLIEAHLATLGVLPGRIARADVANSSEPGDCIDIVLRAD